MINNEIDKGLSEFMSNIEIKRNNGIAEIIIDYFNNDKNKPIRLIGFSTNPNNSDYEIAEEGYHYYQSLKLEIEQ